MATTQYSDLLPEVLTKLPADPSDPVTENAIKRAVIEFCAKSWVWRYLPDPLDLIAGEAVYDLEPPQGAVVANVLKVMVDGEPLENRSIEWLDENVKNWRKDTGFPRFFTAVDTAQVILAVVPSVNIASGISMTLAVNPDDRSSDFPSWIATKYLDEIVAGAVSRLMLIPKKDWSDANLGADYRKQFHTGISTARESVISSFGRAPARSRSQH